MSFGYVCRIDVGGADLRLDNWERAGQADPEQVGGVSRAYAGNQYSSVIEEFMVVPLVSGPISSAEHRQVKALFAKGAQIDCDGDCFNGTTGIVTCSGKVTAEMVPGGIDDAGEPLWIVNLTLTEVGTGLAGLPLSTLVYLTNVTSPTDGSMKLASTDIADDSGSFAGVTLLSGGVIPTCPGVPDTSIACTTVTSAAPEISFLTAPSPNGGYITGAPRVRVHSQGGTSDYWAVQDCFFKIYIVRGGVDVATWTTNPSNGNGGFAGGDVDAVCATSVIFLAEIGDRVRVEGFGRGAYHQGYSGGTLQTIDYGNLGGGTHWGLLILGGSVLFE